jgi:hypothetical protein
LLGQLGGGGLVVSEEDGADDLAVFDVKLGGRDATAILQDQELA